MASSSLIRRQRVSECIFSSPSDVFKHNALSCWRLTAKLLKWFCVSTAVGSSLVCSSRLIIKTSIIYCKCWHIWVYADFVLLRDPMLWLKLLLSHESVTLRFNSTFSHKLGSAQMQKSDSNLRFKKRPFHVYLCSLYITSFNGIMA